MRKLFTLLAFLAVLTLAGPAFSICLPPLFNDCGGDDPAPAGNVNTNTNTATGLGVGVGAAGVFGSGNSENHLGQGQKQFGINKQDQAQDQSQNQGQGQDQFGYVKTDVEIKDNSVHRIDNDFPVNTAAPVFAGNCSQGVSAQSMNFGGSIASGNSVCDFIAVAGAYVAGGDRDEAFRMLDKAEEAADWRFFFSRVRMVLTLGLL